MLWKLGYTLAVVWATIGLLTLYLLLSIITLIIYNVPEIRPKCLENGFKTEITLCDQHAFEQFYFLQVMYNMYNMYNILKYKLKILRALIG